MPLWQYITILFSFAGVAYIDPSEAVIIQLQKILEILHFELLFLRKLFVRDWNLLQTLCCLNTQIKYDEKIKVFTISSPCVQLNWVTLWFISFSLKEEQVKIPLGINATWVQIFVFHIFSIIHAYPLWRRFITNSQNNQLPVGLIAQMMENCTDIAEIMGSISVQAWIF